MREDLGSEYGQGSYGLNIFNNQSILGATENMIGGNAYKPDDVLI